MSNSNSELDEALRPICDAGLVIFPVGGVFARFHIYRPSLVRGNRRLDYSREFLGFRGGQLVVLDDLDAPMSMLDRSPAGDAWSFSAWEWCPGPGPGDFERSYASLDEAVSAILEYYFGDPTWMCAEWEAYRLTRRRGGTGG